MSDPSARLVERPLALVESASPAGVEGRKRLLRTSPAFELGWSYANILEAGARLEDLLRERGFFRLYIYVPDEDGGAVRYAMRVREVRIFPRPEVFTDPVDGRRYLVHSRMMVDEVKDLLPARPLGTFTSLDHRKPDSRHLALGFLFVADPEE